jgi:hypothetical protein
MESVFISYVDPAYVWCFSLCVPNDLQCDRQMSVLLYHQVL